MDLRNAVFLLSILVVCLGSAKAQTLPSNIDAAQWARQMQVEIQKKQTTLTAKSAYEPVGLALARLCQSDPFFFLDEPPFRPAWSPREVLNLDCTWVEIGQEGARVEFGGGFEHFGYHLKFDKTGSNDTLNRWTMSFYDEDVPDKPLMSFALKKSDHVDRDDFIKGALAEFERRAASGAAVPERIEFLLKFDEVKLARTSVRQCAAASDRDWMDQLLAYVIDAKVDAASSRRLLAWAGKMNDFSAYLTAAYAFEAVGDHDAAENSIKSALAKPVDDPEWGGPNARYRGAAICTKLLQCGRYETCAGLCKALLAYTDSKTYLAPEIASILKSAQAAQSDVNLHPAPPAFSDGTYFDPFKGIDLTRLVVSPEEVATKQPVSDNDRLLEYYDHRISADPQNRDNYTTEIAFLLSLNRRDEAFAVCKTAEGIFPDWWRPPVILAFAADDHSRPEAEAKFRKWVAAHPSFIHSWYLSRYDRTRGNNDAALADLQSAVKYPLEMVDEDETWVPMAFAFDAASFAYSQKKYDLVLAIVDVWSKPQGVYNYFDNDIYAFRAAAELAKGEFAEAKKDAEAVVAAAAKQAMWASHLAELEQAATASNRAFVYDPGNLANSGGDWSAIPTVQP